MANTNFIQVNPNQDNLVADLTYSTDSFRLNGGVPNNACPTLDFNKALYQVSTWVAAMANMLVTKGYSPVDGSPSSDPGIVTPTTAVTNLAAVLANIRTNADNAYSYQNPYFFQNVNSSGTVPTGYSWVVEGVTTSSGVTRTLFTVSGNVLYTLKNESGNPVTLAAAAGQYIDGVSSIVVPNGSGPGSADSVTLVSNGSSWLVIAGNLTY